MNWRQTGDVVEQQSYPSDRPAVHGSDNRSPPEQAQIVHELEGKILLLERKIPEERQSAHSQGYQEGLAAGRQQEAAKWTEPQARLARAIEEVSKTKSRLHAEAEDDAVKLSLAVAQKILNRELSVDPEALVGLVKVAMTKLNLRELHRVRVHPGDVQAIEQALSRSAGPIRIEVQADASLERGAALFETERGTLDASVTTQLREIERGLTDMLNPK
jgi:flagellar assembly protein FliH